MTPAARRCHFDDDGFAGFPVGHCDLGMRIFVLQIFGGLERDEFVVAIRPWLAIDGDLVAGAGCHRRYSARRPASVILTRVISIAVRPTCLMLATASPAAISSPMVSILTPRAESMVSVEPSFFAVRTFKA